MTKLTIALLTLVFGLAGTGTADAATTAPLSLRTARFIITNHSGSRLTFEHAATDIHNTWRQAPRDIPDGSVGDYTLTATFVDVGAELRYDLQGCETTPSAPCNPSLSTDPVQGELDIQGDNPSVGYNTKGCQIKPLGTPSGAPPFECSVREDKKGYNDTNFYVTVTRTENVTSRTTVLDRRVGR